MACWFCFRELSLTSTIFFALPATSLSCNMESIQMREIRESAGKETRAGDSEKAADPACSWASHGRRKQLQYTSEKSSIKSDNKQTSTCSLKVAIPSRNPNQDSDAYSLLLLYEKNHLQPSSLQIRFPLSLKKL